MVVAFLAILELCGNRSIEIVQSGPSGSDLRQGGGMSPEEIKPIVGAALMVAGEPLSVDRLTALFGEDDGIREEVGQALADAPGGLCRAWHRAREVAQGFRFQARPELRPMAQPIVGREAATLFTRASRDPRDHRLSPAGHARGHRGPARCRTRHRDAKTLLEREWNPVASGHREVPRRPAVYATTPKFSITSTSGPCPSYRPSPRCGQSGPGRGRAVRAGRGTGGWSWLRR